MGVAQVTGAELGAAIRSVIPPWLTPMFIAITYLGSIGFFFFILTLDYWFGDHERGAHILGFALGGAAVVATLKVSFGLPRPPEAVRLIHAGGYTFPSGHAAHSTIVYGDLAYDLPVGSRSWRWTSAAILISLIALSRVVLRVHYLRDIVAGIGVGLLFLVGGILVTGHDARRGFVLAIVLAGIAVGVTGAQQNAVALLGSAGGAALTWELFQREPAIDSWTRQAALVGVWLPALGALGYIATRTWLRLPAVFVLNAVLLAGIIVAPRLVTRVIPAAPE